MLFNYRKVSLKVNDRSQLNKRLYLIEVNVSKSGLQLYLGHHNGKLASVPLGLYIKRKYPEISDQAHTHVSFTDAIEAENIIKKAFASGKPKIYSQYLFANGDMVRAVGMFESEIIEAREKYDNSVQLEFMADESEEELVGGIGFIQ